MIEIEIEEYGSVLSTGQDPTVIKDKLSEKNISFRGN